MKLSTVIFYALYLGLFASLGLTFVDGVNPYMDRFQNVMTGAYIFTNTILIVLVLLMAVLLETKDKDVVAKIKAVEKKNLETLDSAIAKSTSIPRLIYRYLAFYPAIFCAGILLGYYHLFAAMLIDAVLSQVFLAQMKKMSEKVKEQPAGATSRVQF